MDTWVKKAYNVLHTYIEKYTRDTTIQPEWVAGLIYVECSSLNPKAFRFEPHVYESVIWVKNGKRSTSFPGFNAGKLNDFIRLNLDNESALRSLATSYGLGQIMGYHYVNKYGLKPEKFKNLTIEESVMHTVNFMRSGIRYTQPFAKKPIFEQLLRWHNTGSINGITHNSKYVQSATGISLQYKEYMEGKKQ